MQETQFVFWRTPAPTLPTQQSLSFSRPVWMHSQEWIEHQGEGWQVTGYQIVGSDPESGDIVLSVMMDREIATIDPALTE